MGIYLSKDGISYLWAKIKNKFYSKPSGGIPKSDLASSVQASLGKADSALQSHQDISGKQDKLTAGANITISGNTISAKDTTYSSKSAVSGGTDVSLVTTGEKAVWNAKTSNTGTITGIKMNGVSKGTSGVVDLGTVITAHQDISGKQDKSTAVTHTANTAVGSATKPVYVAADGKATAITHSINADVPANAKFTDTTYSDATQTAHGLMTAADKKKLDGMDLSKYLPLSGGVMSGNIDMATNKEEIVLGDAPPIPRGDLTLPIAGFMTGTASGLPGDAAKKRSFIGTYQQTDKTWHNVISVRHRNGYGDGKSYGMYLRSVLTSGGSLFWNKQTAANTWQGERVLLDSTNYSTYVSTVANATTWNGLTQDCDTYNSGDTWLLVKAGNKIQHRLSYELEVKCATTLTDTGWKALPKASTTPTLNYPGVDYRKYGKMVTVSGGVVFASDQSGPVIGQLPEGCRPVVQEICAVGIDKDTYSTFFINIKSDGTILFSTKTAGFFKKNKMYYINETFFVE